MNKFEKDIEKFVDKIDSKLGFKNNSNESTGQHGRDLENEGHSSYNNYTQGSNEEFRTNIKWLDNIIKNVTEVIEKIKSICGINKYSNLRINNNLQIRHPKYTGHVDYKILQPYQISIIKSRQTKIQVSNLYELYKVFGGKYVVINAETTGKTSKDKVIELSAVVVENGIERSSFSCFIESVEHIPQEATMVNNITDEIIHTQGLRPVDAYRAFITYLGDVATGNAIVVGHDISNDLKFICRELKKAGLGASFRSIDIIDLARQYLTLQDVKLDTLAAYFGIEQRETHRAVEDARLAHQIMEKIVLIATGKMTKPSQFF